MMHGKMTSFIDKICGKAFDERAAVVAKMVTSRHLFGGNHRVSWLYRGHTIEIGSGGRYHSYNSDGALILASHSLPSALVDIDRHPKNK